jgi:hypothetical protein
MNDEQTIPVTHNIRGIRQTGERLRPSRDLFQYFQQYTRERPEVAALWCLGIGFVLGWKLKPW